MWSVICSNSPFCSYKILQVGIFELESIPVLIRWTCDNIHEIFPIQNLKSWTAFFARRVWIPQKNVLEGHQKESTSAVCWRYQKNWQLKRSWRACSSLYKEQTEIALDEPPAVKYQRLDHRINPIIRIKKLKSNLQTWSIDLLGPFWYTPLERDIVQDRPIALKIVSLILWHEDERKQER